MTNASYYKLFVNICTENNEKIPSFEINSNSDGDRGYTCHYTYHEENFEVKTLTEASAKEALAKKIICKFYPDRILEKRYAVQQTALQQNSEPAVTMTVNSNEEHSIENNASSKQRNIPSKPVEQKHHHQTSMSSISYDKFMSFIPQKSEYYLYSLTFQPNSGYHFIVENIGVICKCKISIDYSFPLYEKENKTIANWKYIKRIELDSKQLFLIKIYTNLLFTKLNQSKNLDDETIKKKKNEDYLICILKEDDNTLDMKQIQKTLSTKNYDNMNVLDYINEHGDIKDCYALRTYGDENLRKCPILLKSIEHNSTPLSLFNVKGFPTYTDYYREKYNINPKPNQPLIYASNICGSTKIKIYTKNDCNEEKKEENGIKKEKKERNDLFIPELLVITHSRSDIDNLVFKLPTLLIEFEWAMKFEYLFNKYHFIERCKDINKLRNNLRIALTPSEYNSKENYEVFETMGDKLYEVIASIIFFHKSKNSNEGELSKMRELITSNNYFSKKCKKLKIDQLIKRTNYPREWFTPDLDSKCEIEFSRKTIADVIESITFALYEDSVDLAVYFICYIMEEQFKDYYAYVVAVLNINHYCHTTIHHDKEFKEEEETIRKHNIESILNYDFDDKRILYESFSKSIYHERLEYLGDAILDWILFLDIYSKYKESLTPLIIYDLRANLTSNEAQCYIFCSLGLHNVLIDTTTDHSKIDEYIEKLRKGQINFGNGSEFKTISPLCPSSTLSEIEKIDEFGCGNRNITWKVLSDTFEALIGGVLLDGGINKTIQVVHRIMEPFLSKHMNIDNIKHHPATNLQLYVQENKMNMSIECTLLSDDQYECNIVIDNTLYATEKDFKKKEAVYKAYITANRVLNIANK